MINFSKQILNKSNKFATLDGVVLIGVGVVVLIAGPFAKIAAYGAIAYGLWIIWK